MIKNREEVDSMEPEEYDAYLKTLSPQELKEEEDIAAANAADYQAEIGRIYESGVYKFDWEKINKMSEEEQAEFTESLSPSDLDLYTKESFAQADKRSAAVGQNFRFGCAGIIGKAILYTLAAWVILSVGLTCLAIANSPNPAARIILVIICAVLLIAVISWRGTKQKVEKICHDNGFTPINSAMQQNNLVDKLQDLTVFKSQYGGLLTGFVVISIGEMFALNLPEQAYMARVKYEWVSAGGRYGARSGGKNGQALILESKENLPYIKIAPKTNFFTNLKFVYRPAGPLPEIKIDKDYNLYCAPENAQHALDILMNILPQIKQDKFVVEMSGKWIVVLKWDYAADFDKFVNSALPIAKIFDEKYL